MIRAYLTLAGVIAIVLGLAILLLPLPFYAGYSIVPQGVDLLNELRSHGLFLAATGALIGAGSLRPALTGLSLTVASTLYLCYGAARLIAMALDGLPGSSLVMVTATELAIGLVGLALTLAHRRATTA